MIEVHDASEVNEIRDIMAKVVTFCRLKPQDSKGHCDCFFFQHGKCAIGVPADTEFAKLVPED